MNNKKLQKWFLHIDLDAFFASVEQLDNPQYRGLPVIVGGRKDDKRGVVSTASYEARKFGIHSAMPIFQALRLCPNGIYLRTRMKRYAELSYEIMTIFKEFSPEVEQMSIDEAFIDLTGTEMLFGPPEETAQKIKARVKEQTGLTVSIGLATTKYLAKIASGYSKPDGFYFIKPGEEQNFMLSLPLKKLWGIGPKTLEKLKKAGIYTTLNIYEKSFELLEFLFGNTMAIFLYNIVRGDKIDIFSRKHKSHSISAENTFSEDITDTYTAETELLELAHCVLFRLLKEEKYSRTVTVKIKYDDFTSVTIQRTLENNVLTLDKFYDTIKILFEEKYQKGRGIRLLGVGFDKVENDDRPLQQSLFDNKEDKKQAVEKAILNINKKHPEIKIQKARLLKSIALIFIIISSLSPFHISQNIFAENFPDTSIEKLITDDETKSDNEKKESGTIFNWDINDKAQVDFQISGYWKGDMTGSLISTFPENEPPFFDMPIPIFKQDIELSSLFTLNKKWYFESNFADNFSNNTLTLGYIGNKYFRSGKISNRNITMPDNYSANNLGFGLSGGKNQAPGISAHWQSPYNKWSGDVLIRYDMTSPKSAIFYGMNKVTDNTIAPENYLHSYSFTFPDASISEIKKIKNIYIESDFGNYKDKNNVKFKKLSASEYFYSEQNNILYISPYSVKEKQNDRPPIILTTFTSSSSPDNIINATGHYSDKNSFAGKIQLLFNESDKKYNLEDFSYPLKTLIENENALVIQNSEGFSPYAIANTYDCSTNNNIEISVISKNTKNTHTDYFAETENISYITPYEDFFEKQHIYAKINDKNLTDNRFPFVRTNPQIYLNIKSDSEIALQTRTYNPVSKINIGQKASAGTVTILKNGSYISDFIYNVNTGDIILSKPINNNDQIKITWEEEADNFTKGALSMGLGFQLNILPELKWDIALTAKKAINFNDTISTIEDINSSFIALSTGIDFSRKDFSIYDKAAFAIKKQNDTDKILVSTQNNSIPETYQNKINSGYETKANLFINNHILYKKDNFTIKSHEGEKDNEIQGYKIPLQWDFSKNKDNTSWAAVDLKLEGGKDLKNCSQLEISLCLPEKLPDAIKNYKIFLQLGITAGSDFSSQNKNIPTIDITNKINFEKKEWQKINIRLLDKDRVFLVSNNDARLVILYNPKQEKKENLKGKIYIGPYTTIKKSIATKSDKNIIINTATVPSSEDFYSSEVKWSITDSLPPENTIISAESYFTPADFSTYKTINIKFAYENKTSELVEMSKLPDLSIELDSANIEDSNMRNSAIKLDLYNMTNYVENIKNYHIISIKKNKTYSSSDYFVYIDGIKLNNSDYKLYVNKSIVPSRVKYGINTSIGTSLITNGSFYVDNITFEEPDFIYSADNKIGANYKKDNILTINNYPIFSKAFITADSSQKFTNDNITVLSSFKSGITITTLELQADMLLKKAEFQNAGHNIRSEAPLFKTFSFDESYRWNKQDFSLQKSNIFNLSLSSFNIPLYLKSELSAKENLLQKEQNHKTSLNSNFNIKNNNIGLSSSFETNQKINMIKNNNYDWAINDNYFDSWFNITKFQFSTGTNLNSTRKTILSNKISLNNIFTEPSLTYELSSLYENITTPMFTDKTYINIYIPVNLENHFISFDYSRNGGNILNSIIENNYFSDLEKLFRLQSERKWFYASIPFYELFDKEISSKIKGNYSSKYEIKYNKQLFNSFKDLYIPSSASLSIIRDVKSNENFSDSYQIKATITNFSINNFGKNSEKQIFKWFNQEAITSSFSSIIKIPVDEHENITYKINSYIQILLMIKDNSTLNNIFDFSFETNNIWQTKSVISYSRPGRTCFMSAIASLFSKKLKEKDFDIKRRDNLTISIGSTGKANMINRQQYDYKHYVDMGFLKYFTITSGIGATFSYIENNSSQLSINYSISGKVSF